MTRQIVVIEDDPDLQLVFRIILENAGFTVVAFSDGDELVANGQLIPDLYLLDNQLPGRSGLEICRSIKADPATRNVPVIIISAHKNLGERARAAGADSFVEKPFDYSELVNTITTLTSATPS